MVLLSNRNGAALSGNSAVCMLSKNTQQLPVIKHERNVGWLGIGSLKAQLVFTGHCDWWSVRSQSVSFERPFSLPNLTLKLYNTN